MNEERKPSVSEALRRAMERTYSATVDSANVTRDMAQEILDEVVQRGRFRGRRAAEFRDRLVEALQDMRLATGDDVRALRSRIERLERRVDALESGGGPERLGGASPEQGE